MHTIDLAAWDRLPTAELTAKLRALEWLLDSGMLSDRSALNQRHEIGVIRQVLERRGAAP